MKKRIISALLCAATVLISFSGCNEKTQTDTSNTSTVKADKTDMVKSVDEQIKIIAENTDVWFAKYQDTTYKYCVTDFDRNGRLELFCSGVGGSSVESFGGIFEINSTFDGIAECKGSLIEADVTQIDELFCHIDPETGKIYYEVWNFDRGGSYEALNKNYALSLENGNVDLMFLSSHYWCHLNYENVDIYEIKDYNGNEITKEQHEAIYDTYFEGYEKKTVTLGWHEAERLSYEEWYKTQDNTQYITNKIPEKDELIKILTESYKKFSIK